MDKVIKSAKEFHKEFIISKAIRLGLADKSIKILRTYLNEGLSLKSLKELSDSRIQVHGTDVEFYSNKEGDEFEMPHVINCNSEKTFDLCLTEPERESLYNQQSNYVQALKNIASNDRGGDGAGCRAKLPGAILLLNKLKK